MAVIKPFQGLRFNESIVGAIEDVICPPYDIISTEEQAMYYDKNPNNLIRVEFGKETAEDSDDDNKYLRASKFISDWVNNDVLIKEKNSSYYVYQQCFSLEDGKQFIRTGFIGLVKLEDYGSGVVLAHENTLSKPKADRFNLMTACKANISPIYVLFDDSEKHVVSILQKIVSERNPNVDIVGLGGIREKLWVVSDENLILAITDFMAQKKLYIADGHHRYDTALNYRNKAAGDNENHTGDESYNYTMMLMVEIDDPGLLVLPTHRAIKGLNSFDMESVLKAAKEDFEVSVTDFKSDSLEERANEIGKVLESTQPASFVLCDNNASYVHFKLKDFSVMDKVYPDRHMSYRTLDVCILHKLLLEKLLGIGDAQLASQQYITYTHNILEGLRWLGTDMADMLFFMSATSVVQIRDCSLAGEKMPQKSTYFFPKPPTGLVINKF